VQYQIARNLEQEVAEEKDPGKQAVLFARQSELAVHVECREPHIDSVEVGDHVQHEQEGQQMPAHLARKIRAGIIAVASLRPGPPVSAETAALPARAARRAVRSRRAAVPGSSGATVGAAPVGVPRASA